MQKSLWNPGQNTAPLILCSMNCSKYFGLASCAKNRFIGNAESLDHLIYFIDFRLELELSRDFDSSKGFLYKH